jgi:hypothetical protein
MEKKIKDELSSLKKLARKINKEVIKLRDTSKGFEEHNEYNCISDILEEMLEAFDDMK